MHWRLTAGVLAAIVYFTSGAPVAAQLPEDEWSEETPYSSEDFRDEPALDASQFSSEDDASLFDSSEYQDALESNELRESLDEPSASDALTEAAVTETASRTPLALPGGESKSAVTPQAISLPGAEGSIEGMGESFSPVLSSGTGTFSVPIALPAGRAGVQPSLGLSYSTGGGNGIVGMGWGLGAPMIARQTDRGLPQYVDAPSYHPEEDRFIYNGGQELVPVSSSEMAAVDNQSYGAPAYGVGALPAEVSGWQEYRARVEGGFLRFFRSPDSTRWVVQSKDGTRFDFGLLPAGDGPPEMVSASTAALKTERDDGVGPVFEWCLTRMSDAHGSVVYYQYTAREGQRYLTNLYYLSPASCAAGDPSAQRACAAPLSDYGARVHLAYEARDDIQTSYVPTWPVVTDRRLRRITVTAAGDTVGTRVLVRRYHLRYDALGSGGSSYHSLLSEVQVEGRPDSLDANAQVDIASDVLESSLSYGSGAATIHGRLLPPMTFSYTSPPLLSTTGAIPGFGGIDATVRSLGGSPPHSVDEGRSDLFDVNGDGLPDLIVTDPARYRAPGGVPSVGVFFNGFTGSRADPSTPGTFSGAVPVPIASGLSGTLNLQNLNVVPMDIDGDGRSDLLHMPRRAEYGWFTPTRAADGAVSEVSPADQGWRWSYARVQLPRGVTDPRIDLGRDADRIRAFDVNNDHLVDVVRTTGTSMQTWLNLGWLPGGEGRFGSATYDGSGWVLSVEPIETCLPHAGTPLDFADPEVRLADMNGDGIQDIVRLRRGDVRYWPGRGTGVWGVGPVTCPRGFASGREIRVDHPPRTLAVDLDGVYLRDINADGAADLVQVGFDAVDVYYNAHGRRFTDRLHTRTSVRVPSFARRIRFADIDGSGTTDLIYGNASHWQYLDLMGGQVPRLLAQVDNGLGAVTTLEYGTSADDYTADLAAAASCTASDCDRFTWSRVNAADGCDPKLQESSGDAHCYLSGGSPVVSTVVRAMETNDQFSSVGRADHIVRTEYAYHDGYYEGIEQEFRGFGAADAVAIGDAEHPTSISRTFFLQGRRPNAIARDRLADNPREALKARAYLSETFDEFGRYLSTAHSSYAVRTLMTGLDGRAIRYAYVRQSDELRYDTAAWAPGGGTLNELPEVGWQRADGMVDSAYDPETRNVLIRGAGYAHLRSTTDTVDNLGHLLQQTAHGRVTGEHGETPSEAIVSHAVPVLVSASDWIWRTARTYLTGDGHTGLLGDTTTTFNAVGDAIRSVTQADAPTTFDFGGDSAGAQGFTQGDQDLEASTTYDAWGNATATCAGADLSLGAAACLRYATVTYDPAYTQLPVSESIAVGKTLGSFDFLTTSATWQRGYGQLLTATDPNAEVTSVSYDGLGRLTGITPPGATFPVHRFDYALNVDGEPVSVIYGWREHSALWVGASPQLVTRTYVDGLGRTRAVLSKSQHWEQSGVQEYTARGTVRASWQPHLIAYTADPSLRSVLALPSSATHLGEIGGFDRVVYDAFGRAVVSYDADGDATVVSHRALSTEVWDPLDQRSSSSHIAGGTPTVSRVDGHGRAIDQVLINRRSVLDANEYYRLFTDYRPDGAVMAITRAQTTGYEPRETATIVSGRSTTRTFTYDTAGRRLASTDPDTDSTAPGATAANETWRYLFNRVGDLVAVRDPRGCGQNFYYDHGGRLLGEDYVQCGESQDPGDLPTDDIPGSAIADGELGAARFVDVRHYFDADPGWASDVTGSLHADAEARPTSPYLVGRMTASADRGQRTLYAYDARGRGVWQARQMALIPTDSYSASTLSGDRPSLVTSESVTTGTREYDEAPDHTYVLTNTYDFGDRATGIGLPLDPDFGLLSGTPTAPPPPVTATMNYNWLSLPNNAIAYIDGTPQTIIWQQVYARDRIPFLTYFGDDKGPGGVSRTRSRIWTTLDPLRRLPTKSEFWRDNGGVAVTTDLQTYQRPFREYYGWDDADNLVSVTNNSTDTYPAGYRRQRRLVEHDALYRVQHVDFAYHDNHLAWTPTDTALDPRATRQTHLASDPMRERPAPMLPSLPSNRVVNLTYEYDWLANMTEWTDDAASFYERSIGQIANGFEEGKRPSALYLSTNLSDTAPTTYSATLDRGGWLEVGYGASGNVETLTVRAQCHDRDALNLCYDSGGNVDARATGINQGCQCDREQHYQYRWDELNRMSEARRYDRTGAGDWDLKVRQRYRYSAGNQRMVKQTLDADPDPGTPAERIHLYVYPGDFERSGVRLDAMNLEYDADATLGTETQYMIAGARIVWRAATDPNHALQKDIRVTYAMTDLIQSTSAVIDLYSGALLETRTYYPNGAIETHRAQDNVTMQLEPLGFTSKEADDEVGVVYFGERYLIPRIGRWASPDPLHVHAVGGGEALNSYHYVSGNLLQVRDQLGLQPPPGMDARRERELARQHELSQQIRSEYTGALEADDNTVRALSGLFQRHGVRLVLDSLSRGHDGKSFASAGPSPHDYFPLGQSGFRSQLMDDGGGDQGRHFMQAFAIGFHRSDWQRSAAIAHEAAEPEPFGLRIPYVRTAWGIAAGDFDGPASEAVDYVLDAARSGNDIDFGRLDSILDPLYQEFNLPEQGVDPNDPGRSRGDVRATVVGIAMGEAARQLELEEPDRVFTSKEEFVDYFQRNVGESDAQQSQ